MIYYESSNLVISLIIIEKGLRAMKEVLVLKKNIFIVILSVSILALAPVYGEQKFKSVEEEIAAIKWETNNDNETIADPNAVKGGTITYAFMSPPNTLRYYGPNSSSQVTSMLTNPCYESLCGLSPITMKVTPGLACAWAIGPDKKTFYFKINPKAKWADGKPVTAEDVQVTWDFLTSEFIKDPAVNYYYKKLNRPRILAPRIVKITAKTLDWRNFMKAYGMMIWPAHKLKELKIYPKDENDKTKKDYIDEYQFKMMLGSGPYEFYPEKFKKGEEIWLRRRKDYWNADDPTMKGIYNFDYWKFIIIRDENLIFEKFKAGEIDLFIVRMSKRWVTECDFDKVQKGWIQKKKVFTDYARGISGIAFNMRKPPFNDVRVRRAFRHLLNIKELVQMTMYNEYLLLDSYFPGSVHENPDNSKIRYNPDKAIKLLREAGWDRWDEQGRLCNKNGQPFIITIPYTQDFERPMVIFQEYLKDVGITLKLKLITRETKWELIMERKFLLSYQSWTGSQFPNPRSMWHSSMAGRKQTINICGVSDEIVDALIEEYEKFIPLSERVKILRKLDKRLCELQPYALSYYAPHTRILYWNKFGMPKSVLGKQMSNAVWTGIFTYWYIDPEKERALKEAMAKNKPLKREPVVVKFWKKWNKYYKSRLDKNGKLPEGETLMSVFREFYDMYKTDEEG